MAKLWRKNNMKRAMLIKEQAKTIPPKILKSEARTFFSPEQANPSKLILTLIYGKNYMDTLGKLAELGEARRNFRILNPDTPMPKELNDALAVRAN